jgi:hypothetical protein
MISIVTCPKCKNEFELNEALDKDLREQIEASLKEDHLKELNTARQLASEETRKLVIGEYNKKAEAIRTMAFEAAKKEATEENSAELELLRKQLQIKDEKVRVSQEKEIKLREEKAAIEEEKKELDLTVARRVDEEKAKAVKNATDTVSKDYQLKISEKDKQLDSMQQTIEELRKKSNITSQQLQRGVLELDVYDTLIASFPDDEITEVEKFKNGADIRQTVKSRKGLQCGKILWECKRTNIIKNDFISKLKEDMLREVADFGVIVTTTLPKQAINGLSQIDGVWVCNQQYVEPLCSLLRTLLIGVARERWINQNKGNKGDQLISYFTSAPFAQVIQDVASSLLAQKNQINKERQVYQKMWSDREAQIDRQTRSITKMLSSVQEHVGSGMQSIDAFDLLSLQEGDA